MEQRCYINEKQARYVKIEYLKAKFCGSREVDKPSYLRETRTGTAGQGTILPEVPTIPKRIKVTPTHAKAAMGGVNRGGFLIFLYQTCHGCYKRYIKYKFYIAEVNHCAAWAETSRRSIARIKTWWGSQRSLDMRSVE